MKTTNYILDSLKEKFGSEDDDGKGFPDMNYIVGNTSGLDIGNVPSPLDQRIGRMSQIGGSIMEVQITNPATFQIDRPEVINVVDRVGLDMTLHGDPNIGFTAAYATGGRVTGYNIVHRYFKRYLEQMAGFKYEIDTRREDQSDPLDFHLGYVNMHASNEMIPALEERLASDVSVDPFGNFITDITGDKQPNIYDNKDFMRKLFSFWFLEKVERPYQFYENVFSDISEEFNEAWRGKKKDAANHKFEQYRQGITSEEEVNALVGAIQTASSIDQELGTEYLNELENYEFSDPIEVEIEAAVRDDEDNVQWIPEGEVTFGSLKDLTTLRSGARTLLDTPRSLSRDLYHLRNGEVEGSLPEGRRYSDLGGTIADRYDDIRDLLMELLEELWEEASAEARISALSRNLDIQQSEILEYAEPLIKEEARAAFAGDEDFYEEPKAVDPQTGTEKPKNLLIMERLADGRLEDELNKESSIYFHIIPAWMMSSEYDAVQFMWKHIVGEEDVDALDFEDYSEFRQFYMDKRERQLNVIAAVGACYLWGHFTQNPDVFSPDVFEEEYTPESFDDDESMTWIEWMNRWNLKVNIEAMYGSPGELRRLWRPKDIAIACRAINMTAEEEVDNYKEPLLKFTIDMEHTASYGVDPVREIEAMVDQEKEIVGGDKPLSDIVKTYHLTKPGWEQQQGHRHGPFARGDKTLYTWLYTLVENGFARNEEDPGIVMFEVGGEYREEMYVIRVAMNLIELGVTPDELDPSRVDPGKEYENEEEALIARFFGMDRPSYSREWAKIEQHAFDPLKGLLEAEEFDFTYSGRAAVENDNRPAEWNEEEYK